MADTELQFSLNGGWVQLTQYDGFVTYPVTGGGTAHCPCMAFAQCDREAVTTMPNPVLGDVPCCTRCHDKLERLS